MTDRRLLALMGQISNITTMLGDFIRRRRLDRDGYTVARRFLSASATRDLVAIVHAVYNALSTAESIEDPNLADHFHKWQGVWVKALPQFLSGTDAELGTRLGQTFESIVLRTRRLLGEDWYLFDQCSFFRRPNSQASLLRWHIDADGGQLNRAMCVNVWLPLDAVGGDLPSLNVIPGSHRKMRELPLLTGGDYDRDDAFAAALGRAVTPRLKPGDALIFDQYTLHRSQPIACKEFSRTSCELRFACDTTTAPPP
jgi:ectoine hydroxylase-related dioxygenase (phytanoyl-CoA dioxygenase family)